MQVETVNDIRSSVAAELAAELAGENAAPEQAAVESVEIPDGDEPEGGDEGPETATQGAEEPEGEQPEGEGDQDEETGEPETVVDPPHFWSKEEKEKFASWPLEVQEQVKAKADADERYLNQQKQEAAEAKKAAAGEARMLSEISKRIEAAAEAAELQFADKWKGADPQWWATLARDNPASYTELKAQFDADQYAAQQATAAREATERLQREQWVKDEGERLKSLVPQLFGPDGKKVGEELKGYLTSSGAAEQDLSDLSAVAWQMAYKAMMYDKAQKSKPIQKKSVATALPSKSAPPPRATVQQAERKAVETKAYGSEGRRPDRAAMAELLIKDGYA